LSESKRHNNNKLLFIRARVAAFNHFAIYAALQNARGGLLGAVAKACHESEPFILLDRTWKLLMYPFGNQQSADFSAYLKLCDLVEGETYPAHFYISVTHPREIYSDRADMVESQVQASMHAFELDAGSRLSAPLQTR
jgi:hypothetical protein